VINEARALLAHEREIDPLTVRQLRRILFNAAEGPMTNPELTAARIDAETRQASTLNGFEFKLAGNPLPSTRSTTGFESLTDVSERRALWEASKESGPALRPGLVELQGLRNRVARRWTTRITSPSRRPSTT